VIVFGIDLWGEGGFGFSDEIFVVNANDPEGDTKCGPLPTPNIVSYRKYSKIKNVSFAGFCL
jgi:hypothetical protein|tara:strand:+ start:1983 stop:2168 length:186 start_codon:yes stop_codon:yes gene_type:complete